MATPTDTLWSRDPHTAAKHDILRRYLAAWFPIVAASYSDVGATFADAFAGPGEYLDGSHGSPLIVIAAAGRTEVAQHHTPLRLVFIERDRARFEHLQKLVEQQVTAPSTEVTVVSGACQDELLPTLERVGAWGGPLFVNFDGWGVDTPYDLVQRVARNPSSEVLITFESQWFTRFATLTDLGAGDRVFGDTAWRAVSEVATRDKKRFLIDRYLDQVRAAGFIHTLTFEMLDEGGHDLLLVFGTTVERGVQKMKDAMWTVDRVHGQRFRDPRDVNQLSFEALGDDPDLTLLKIQILDRLSSGGTDLASLGRHALLETVYRAEHVPLAVRALEIEGRVLRTKARRHEDVWVELAPDTLFS